MTPGGVTPVVHLSQYDEAFQLEFTLYSRTGELDIPSGATAMIEGTKLDGKAYSANAAISGNVVTVTGDVQISAVAGNNPFQIVLKSGNSTIGSANFTISVERAALDYDTVSDSKLAQIQDISGTAAQLTAAAENVTDGVETFEALAESVSDMLADITDDTLSITDKAADAAAVGNALAAEIAPKYSTSATYAVGDYALYNNVLYRCNTAITTAESWTAAHWTAVKVGPELGNLKREITHFLSLDSDDATVIPANSDFDDYTTPGNYKVTSVAVSETIANIPYETSGRLTVARTTGPDRIMQIYWCNSSLVIAIYYRFNNAVSWGNWIQLDDPDMIDKKVALTTLRDVYPRANNPIQFTKTGTSITVTIPYSLAHYLNVDGKMRERSVSSVSGTEITVPHDSFAIYSITDSAIEVKTLAELQSLADNSYIPLFYNSSGNVHGLWEKYAILQNINYQGEVYFYGNGTYPTFHVLDDYSIDVTIPSNARVNYYDLSVSPPLFKNGISTNISAQTINVPHDKCLVYDVSTRNLSVENYNFDYDHNKTVLFYNSHGIVNGQWYRYYLRQLNEETQNGYPAYFRTHLTERIDTINTLLTAQGTSTMLFITDHHYPSNNLKSVGIVKTVCKEAGITKVFLGGDYINRENLKAEALRNINRIGGMYIYPGVKTFRLCGNHEFNNPGASSDETIVANQLTSAELRHVILNTFITDVTVDENSLSYYYDDDINKIRYIVGSVTYTSSLDANSVAWVCDQLTRVPSGWSAVVLFHTILKYADGVTSPVNSATNLINVLDAFKQKDSYTFGGVTYDFSSTGAELICAICADMHVDTEYTTNGGVHIIATTTDSRQELGGLTRTVGDISEIAFDVFVFNTAEKTIDCVRFGAGESRFFSY